MDLNENLNVPDYLGFLPYVLVSFDRLADGEILIDVKTIIDGTLRGVKVFDYELEQVNGFLDSYGYKFYLRADRENPPREVAYEDLLGEVRKSIEDRIKNVKAVGFGPQVVRTINI